MTEGFAQVGERRWAGVQEGTCPEDCPVPYVSCPATPAGGPCAGAGLCYTNTGTCDCFLGCAPMPLCP
jgi:hypothetical protein